MHHIILDSEIDFDGWRQAARTLALNGVNPSDVRWTVRGNEPELFETQNIEEPPEPSQNTFDVPAKFIALARVTILHRARNALPSSTACCGGYAAITTCSTPRPIRMWLNSSQ